MTGWERTAVFCCCGRQQWWVARVLPGHAGMLHTVWSRQTSRLGILFAWGSKTLPSSESTRLPSPRRHLRSAEESPYVGGVSHGGGGLGRGSTTLTFWRSLAPCPVLWENRSSSHRSHLPDLPRSSPSTHRLSSLCFYP